MTQDLRTREAVQTHQPLAQGTHESASQASMHSEPKLVLRVLSGKSRSARPCKT